MLSEINALDYLVAHWRAGFMVGAVSLTVSLCLVARLWIVHRRAGIISRLAWSFVLLVPVFGWLFFAAFFHAPWRMAGDGHAEHGQAGHDGYATGHAGSD